MEDGGQAPLRPARVALLDGPLRQDGHGGPRLSGSQGRRPTGGAGSEDQHVEPQLRHVAGIEGDQVSPDRGREVVGSMGSAGHEQGRGL